MLPGAFARKLRALNPHLKIWCKDDPRFSAGLFHVVHGDYTEICGVDKNEVPEHTVCAKDGRIIKTGWRRVLRILIGKKLVRLQDAERMFDANLRKRWLPILTEDNQGKVQRRLQTMGFDVVETNL